MSKQNTDEQAFDARYKVWLESNPGRSFSDYFDSVHVPKIRQGNPHASLGRNLTTGDWRTVGSEPFQRITDIYCELTGAPALAENTTVCEVGCGTLRIGAHFINHLEPGRFVGLDISQGLIDEGRAAFGELVAQKSPALGTFDTCLDTTIQMKPDLVFAMNVVCHVHPDEEALFYDRLFALTQKPGCVLILQVMTYSEPMRYQESGWAKPLRDYIDRLQPMAYHPNGREFIKSGEKAGRQLDSLAIAFRR